MEIKYKTEHINTHSAFIPFVLNLHHYSTLKRPQRFFLGRIRLTHVASFISKMTHRLFQNGNGMHNSMFHLGICSRSHGDAEGWRWFPCVRQFFTIWNNLLVRCNCLASLAYMLQMSPHLKSFKIITIITIETWSMSVEGEVFVTTVISTYSWCILSVFIICQIKQLIYIYTKIQSGRWYIH